MLRTICSDIFFTKIGRRTSPQCQKKTKMFYILVTTGEQNLCKNFLFCKKYEESLIKFSGESEKILVVVIKGLRVHNLRVPSSHHIRICISYSVLISCCCLEYPTYVSHLQYSPHQNLYFIQRPYFLLLFRVRDLPGPSSHHIIK